MNRKIVLIGICLVVLSLSVVTVYAVDSWQSIPENERYNLAAIYTISTDAVERNMFFHPELGFEVPLFLVVNYG